ncbi:MAG: hypothetical protein IT185_07315 [Acidobacteria bacterium]|jgi:hypothetical protein|nr:hypothetical protein [Acidobacteriota bacterium]
MRCLWPVLIAAVLGASSYAQGGQFVLSSRDRADLIAVDFSATNQDGVPIETLGADDITVRLGGRVRRVLGVEFVRTAAAVSLLDPPYGDNSARSLPRSLILMVDEDTIRPGRTQGVRDAAQQLVSGLSAQDRLALVTVPFGGLKMDLTTDHGRVLQAMTAVTAQGSRAESAADTQCRTLRTLGAVTETLLRLSAVEDPVTVVLLSSHQAGPQNEIRQLGQASAGGACELRTSHFTDLGVAAARARARFYVVHADVEQRSRSLDGLEHMVGVTGGSLLHLSTNEGRAAIGRILTETAGHYVARVSRAPSDKTGVVQNISVSTSRPDVTIRRTPQFVMTAPAAVKTDAGPAAVPSIRDLIRRADLVRDLPVRVTAHPFRDDDPARVRLAVTLDSPESGATLSSAMIGVFDARGQLVSGLELSAEALQRRPVVAALSVPAGEYRLRAAAVESSGRGGTAEQAIAATLTDMGPIQASAVMIGLSREGAFVPALEFSSEPTAFGMLELYGALTPAPRVVFEIATTLNGAAVLTMPGLVEASAVPTRVLVTAVLPISQLAPGDYVVRVTVTPEGRPGARLTRTLRKVGVQSIKEPAH